MYLNTETNEFPRFQGDLELLGWVAGTPLPHGWVEVEQAEYPTDIPTDFKVVANEPEQVNGKWIMNFSVIPMTEEEIERRNAPVTAKAKLLLLGLTENEITALMRGLIK